MKLVLDLPALSAPSDSKPETRPPRVAAWLADTGKRDVTTAARMIGDALAATNRASVGDARRVELLSQYWKASTTLWSPITRLYLRSQHPLTAHANDAARASITLAGELADAYKRQLVRETDKRISLGGQKLMVALLRRAMQASHRLVVNCYLSYSPLPPRTWYDMHVIYAFARARGLHQTGRPDDASDVTPESIYLQTLLLALANPYGFHPGQIEIVMRYVSEHAQLAKIVDVPPVHRMAKAVAIIPVGHDFPPFSANKGGSVNGPKLYLLTFDLAFQLQEELQKLENGGDPPPAFRHDVASRSRNLNLLRRLLRQWAIPPARQFSRLPARGRIIVAAGFMNAWHGSRTDDRRLMGGHPDLAPPTTCQILNQTPGGYALRQVAASPAPLRIGDLIALRVDGKPGLQVGIVRWFRNTTTGRALEFGCELVSDVAQAATAAAENALDTTPTPVVVLPAPTSRRSGKNAAIDQIVVPTGAFGLEHAVGLWHDKAKHLAVLTKFVDQGPDFEIYEFAAVA